MTELLLDGNLFGGVLYEAAASGSSIDIPMASFSGIPSIRIVLEAATDHTVGEAVILTMDSITSYSSSYTESDADGTSPTMFGSGLDGSNEVSAKVGTARSPTEYAVNLFNVTEIVVHAWEDSDRFTQFSAESYNPSSAATSDANIHWSKTTGAVNSDAAITTIHLALGTGEFVTGSRVKVYAL